jgi:OPA family glycerol-3-phosphate transporter-like MFS transporter
LLIEEFKGQGLTKSKIGDLVFISTFFYAAGKFISGLLTDKLGGRRMFLTGMGGAIFCTVLFALGGFPIFTLAFSANRFIQSMGWPGLVKIASKWFRYSNYGAVMGLLSLSYLFGDSLSRLFLGQLIAYHVGWRGVFYAAAGTLGVVFLLNLFFLRESPSKVGEEEPATNPENVFATRHAEEKLPVSVMLGSLLTNPVFIVVCVVSFGFTVLRETFNNWTPLYLTEAVGLSKADAAKSSALFPLFGGISVILAGWASDKLGRVGRAAILCVGATVAIPLLLQLASPALRGASLQAQILLSVIGFLLIGPYSFLAGSIALDFGGKHGSATASGFIDGVGYIGGMIAGKVVGDLAEKQGWGPAFTFLAVVSGVTAIVSAVYWILRQKRGYIQVEPT